MNLDKVNEDPRLLKDIFTRSKLEDILGNLKKDSIVIAEKVDELKEEVEALKKILGSDLVSH